MARPLVRSQPHNRASPTRPPPQAWIARAPDMIASLFTEDALYVERVYDPTGGALPLSPPTSTDPSPRARFELLSCDVL